MYSWFYSIPFHTVEYISLERFNFFPPKDGLLLHQIWLENDVSIVQMKTAETFATFSYGTEVNKQAMITLQEMAFFNSLYGL